MEDSTYIREYTDQFWLADLREHFEIVIDFVTFFVTNTIFKTNVLVCGGVLGSMIMVLPQKRRQIYC